MDKIKEPLQRILAKSHWHTSKQSIKENKHGLNFACPVCGDSDKDTTKKRAWILTDKAEPYFFCHHECGGMSLPNFFKHFGETYEVSERNDFFLTPVKAKPKWKYDPKQMALTEISRLAVPLKTIIETFGAERIDENHPEWNYLVQRNLQDYKDYFLYWPSKHRLIILNTVEEPYTVRKWNQDGYYTDIDCNVIGFQARGLGNHQVKYITYTLEKIRGECGLDYRPAPGTEDYVKVLSQVFFSTHVDWEDTVLITEGPIDALFLENSIALTGASKRHDKIDINYHCQYIFDNDTTGLEQQKDKAIKYPNKQIFSWKRLCKQIGNSDVKDINDVVNHCVKSGIPIPKFKEYFL